MGRRSNRFRVFAQSARDADVRMRVWISRAPAARESYAYKVICVDFTRTNQRCAVATSGMAVGAAEAEAPMAATANSSEATVSAMPAAASALRADVLN